MNKTRVNERPLQTIAESTREIQENQVKPQEQAILSQISDQLIAWFQSESSYVVAFSGGVDSAVVASAANRSDATVVLATARGPSVSQRDLNDAKSLAALLTLEHHWIETGEINDSNYQANGFRRCYFCKSHLFAALQRQFPQSIIVSGTNSDDLDDYRPGLQAAQEYRVRAPLAELGINKRALRQLAAHWNLPVFDKPASPCLASRIAYGVEVTPERLAMIERAENFVKDRLAVNDCRVRLHESNLARIELPDNALPLLLDSVQREELFSGLRELGFRFITLDLAGLRSGSLNEVIQITHAVGIAPAP